ncbi:response regulator [Methylorubrum extorquens]|uniref:response regulator n=1 Tax=Methylorubrum extorquens TaxID=408 RepID=UPI001EE5AC83|nr:response regulator [Methylorubrum extorquens]MCG5249633.1 response regulator [Methylorubrum extorquens]
MIEDEPVLRIEISDMLEDEGFEVVEATNVENAIHILETRPDIRIVYMDLDMPNGVDGVKIAAAIRDRWPPIEIVLTASRIDGARLLLPVRAKFFPKPVNRARVMEAVRVFAGQA